MDNLDKLTEDLKNGFTLEEALIKNNTNLREVFKNINRYPVTRRKPRMNIPAKDEWRNIQPTKNNTYRLVKTVNGVQRNFGTYKIFEEAKKLRDYLETVGWDKDLMNEFIIKHNIKRQKKLIK